MLCRSNQVFSIDGLAGEGDFLFFRELLQRVRWTCCPAGDGRQEGHLVAVMQDAGGGCVFGVDSYGDAGERERGAIAVPWIGDKPPHEIGDGCPILKLDESVVGTEPIFQHPKANNLDVHR
jgi:hypothetical protein